MYSGNIKDPWRAHLSALAGRSSVIERPATGRPKVIVINEAPGPLQTHSNNNLPKSIKTILSFHKALFKILKHNETI